MKSFTPKQFAFYTSTAITFSAAVFLLVFYLANVISIKILPAFVFCLALFIVCFIAAQLLAPGSSKEPDNTNDNSLTQKTETNGNKMQSYEANRLEIEELQRLAQYRKEFLGNVSHELKTPIFNIQGYLETLIDGGIKDERINLDYLSKAAKNVERLSAIVKDLEQISKLESGNLKLELERVEIHELVDEVFESLEMKAHFKNIALEKTGNVKDAFVNVDREKIRQVLNNLILNGINYGKEGGMVRVHLEETEDKVLVDIEDNGIGMKPEILPRIFERFYRVDKSRSREQGGTGLGLAIVKHIIEAHGQTIAVRSEEGKGTAFSFTLKKA